MRLHHGTLNAVIPTILDFNRDYVGVNMPV